MKTKIKKMLCILKEWLIVVFKKLKKFCFYEKENWLNYTFFFGLFSASLVLLGFGSNQTFNGKLENLSYEISTFAKNDTFNTVSLNIEPNDANGKETINNFRNYKYINGYETPQFRINNSFLSINSNLSNEFMTKYENEDEFSPKSIIFPSAFSSTECIIKNGVTEDKYYLMDDLKLYLKYKKPQISGNGINWCIISSDMAKKKAEQMNLNSEELLINKTIKVSYSLLNEKQAEETWKIIGIYDSNLGDAKKLTAQCGDFILSWRIYVNSNYSNMKGLSISFELHQSIKNNCNVIKRCFNDFEPANNEYNFISLEKNQKNSFLSNCILDVYSYINNNFWNSYNISSIIMFLTFVILVIFEHFIKKKNSISSFTFLIAMLLCTFAVYQMITLSLQKFYFPSLVVYHSAQSVAIIYLLIIVYLYLIKLISYKTKTGKVKQ